MTSKAVLQALCQVLLRKLNGFRHSAGDAAGSALQERSSASTKAPCLGLAGSVSTSRAQGAGLTPGATCSLQDLAPQEPHQGWTKLSKTCIPSPSVLRE